MTETIERIPRQEFIDDVWSYKLGEHVTFLGPTGSGKTQLKWGLLSATAGPDMPAVVTATKPRDRTTDRWRKHLQFRLTREWPPMPDVARPVRGKPPGLVLWPRHTMDIDVDDAAHYAAFKAYLNDAYRKGDQIADVDEVLDFVDLRLERELRRMWTRGRSMGAGLWAGTQQPFHIPTHAYRQSQHLFIAKDPDWRSRRRYDEIGGIDSRMVEQWVMGLKRWEFLYLRRADGSACIVEK